ncbi:MAG: glutamate--tRNA ligase [Patescibacteria group bacterium]
MVRVRFAPSPTGELHIGGARTALYNYLFAQKNNGKFILRLEDTDRERYVKGSEKRLLDDLTWLGINWDEGPNKAGKFGPYVQSERLAIYKKYLADLIKKEKAYYCFCSVERLDELRKQQQLAKQPTKYDRRCCSKSNPEIQQLLNDNQPYVIRLKVPPGKTNFVDLIYGNIIIDNSNIDDQVLLKSDGYPTYHLANVVDDHLMGVSHVIRGEEWLPSTPKHVLLYKAFGWLEPIWAHLPNVLNKQKIKLSKRKDGEAVWLSTYIKNGYLQPAIINFLALLGWHPHDNQELFILDELISIFDINRVQKAGAIFDIDKLNWFNAKYIKSLTLTELDHELKPYYPATKFATPSLTKLLQSRLITLKDAVAMGNFYFIDKLNIQSAILIPKNSNQPTTFNALKQGSEVLAEVEKWELRQLRESLDLLINNGLFTKKDLLWPIRVALTGQEQSPDVYEVLEALGKPRSIARLNDAVLIMQNSL